MAQFGDYNYATKIKTPDELGMGTKGSMKQLRYNIAGMIDYVNILVTGKSPASKANGGPLGNAFFIDTKSKCLASGVPKPRHLYINNVPDGRLPFLSGKTSVKLDSFRGLIPGIIEDVSALNPEDMIKSFGKTDPPSCSLKTFKVIDNDGKIYKESRYISDEEVAKADFKELKDSRIKCNPNTQSNKGNVCCITNEEEKKIYDENDELLKCIEGFTQKNNPYTYFQKKKLDKHFKMFILFVILMILIFI